jgi:hypothetical protein
MARRIQVVLDDDIDGSPADSTVPFSLDGVDYEIDLSSENAERLRAALQPFVANARRAATSRKKAGGARSSSSGRDLAAIRSWARDNGVPVSQRGRIAASVIAQYDAAQRPAH